MNQIEFNNKPAKTAKQQQNRIERTKKKKTNKRKMKGKV